MPDKPIDTLLPATPAVTELVALLEDAEIRPGIVEMLDDEVEEIATSNIPRRRVPRGR